ncbi:hypothetical protein ACIG0C_04550 [Kitasatospora aureofaciens]|uniref:Uncharacterized protein n=1 Tax=Kitasatospora aureofaciens TaxID=1894 RepID=A0A1E7N332_KITAU|nr:hypothetical protein [Kitasatospora aureofaciens]OEV35090.1 hypothetical protein HS99_0034070 [Kitasatospora aureofaciens]QEV00097.1 hypothetical protein CP971_13105 [Streptomyces viridifaciens]UKZ06286.1 hypothetical protein BOQ63_019990 [Streptomyces viridifaciens]GGU76485.1 hypothetical protein GCM10010502_30280 [Kitasatospora aureofaciens]
MANDQSETPVPSTPGNAAQTGAPAAAVEAGKAVEGAVTASSNPAGYTAPTDADKTAFENGSFGDEGEYINEPAGEPGGPLKPESVVGGHP